MPTPDEAAAYMAFLAALCRMARDAKRVIATEKPVESEKYSFRIILIRLGFNGKENAAVRKTLLQWLPGKGREVIWEMLKRNELRLVTEEQHQCIDHIGLSAVMTDSKQILIEEWNQNKSLSDHKGILVRLEERYGI